MTLFRPVGPDEMKYISQYQRFPPRFSHQPIFYPVLSEEYANEINEKWNVPAYKGGYTVRFDVDDEFISQYSIQNVGGVNHNELWIPAEDLQDLNDHIIDGITLLKKFA